MNKTEIPEWLKREVEEYDMDLVAPPATVLDLGANVGAFTMRAKKLWPNAEVFAYEPSKENANAFRTNCADLNGVHFEESAVRGFSGVDVLRVGDGELSVTAGFHDIGRHGEGRQPVTCIAASELPSCEFVKIDTEGCELEILNGIDTSKTKALAVEWHKEEDRETILNICKERGFAVVGCDNANVLRFAKPGAVKKIKVFIGVPVNAEMKVEFAACLLALQSDKSNQFCEFDVRFGHGDGVARTRNNLTDDFLKSDCTHMLQIDCDIVFGVHHVKRILSHNKDVIGGFYPKKQEGPLEWVINTFPGPVDKRADGLHKVAYIGTGFLCVRRNVFERMIEAFPYIAFTADFRKRQVQHDFWPMSPYCAECGHSAGPSCTHDSKSRRYLSEDWYFCQRWMDLGGEVFGDTGVTLRHVGPAVYPLITQLPEIANPRKPVSDLPSSDTARTPLESFEDGEDQDHRINAVRETALVDERV